MKNLAKKLAGFILLAGILFGLFVVIVAPFEMIRKAQAESWPSRKGVITLSYAERTGGNSRVAHYWRTEICGTYRDDGQRFCIRRVRFGGFRFGEGKADALSTIARYPVGKEVDVYHAPDDPKETLLEARSSWREMCTLMGLGLFFLLIPVVLWALKKWGVLKSEPDVYRRK